ncbi:MAG: hypothetical protein HC890_15910 [Chloroflexaceae bacterium]|nr:hypothetical protein [Chloroflexaceae bacterium]
MPLAVALTAEPVSSQVPAPAPAPAPNGEVEDVTDPNIVRPLSQSDSLLSLQGGQRLLTEAEQAIEAEQYVIAAEKLQKARQIFNQLTNFYLQLANSFSGIENRIFEAQRRNAAQTGQMRDEATYNLALVHRAQNQAELSVPLLIQVIRSQNPTSELGRKAYQQLYEIGFVDAPYSTSSN